MNIEYEMTTLAIFRRFIRGMQKRAWYSLGSRGLSRNLLRHHEGQCGCAMCVNERRYYREDDYYPHGSSGEDSDEREKHRRQSSFQRPEYGGLNNTEYWRSNDAEPRRRIIQDSYDHQKRQARIIAENRQRWISRTEPKPHPNITTTMNDPITSDRDPAKEYSRRRRKQRQEEVKRQERELRESRKNYKLPGYNAPKEDEKAEMDDQEEEEQQQKKQQDDHHKPTIARDASAAWLAKRAEEEERNYWHSWYTCPRERDSETREASGENKENPQADYQSTKRRRLTKPPQSYDGSVRRFQTYSHQTTKYIRTKRKPSGLEKQVSLAYDIKFPWQSTGDRRLMSHGSLASSKVFWEEKPIKKLKATASDNLNWKGMPSSIYKRFGNIKKSIDRKEEQKQLAEEKQRYNRKGLTKNQCLVPPRFSMTRRKLGTRPRVPIDSFSTRLPIKTQFIPRVEYLGYGKQSILDSWVNYQLENRNDMKRSTQSRPRVD